MGSPSDNMLGLFWVPFGPSWSHLGTLLGLFWGPYGASWGHRAGHRSKDGVHPILVAPLEAKSSSFGALLGLPWAALGRSWGRPIARGLRGQWLQGAPPQSIRWPWLPVPLVAPDCRHLRVEPRTPIMAPVAYRGPRMHEAHREGWVVGPPPPFMGVSREIVSTQSFGRRAEHVGTC